MPVSVEKISPPLVLGEGPHWDEREQALYFVSIHEKSIHKYELATGQFSSATLDGRVGFIVPVSGRPGEFVAGVERRLALLEWRGAGDAVVRRVLHEVDDDFPDNRINDGKADPRGRLFAGTMGYEATPGEFAKEKGSLFRLDGADRITKVCQKIGISNGLAWDLTANTMYYIDSLERNIRAYDYDVDTGEISNMRHVFDTRENGVEGFLDGCTIDTSGRLWVAVFGGGCVIQVDPVAGKILRSVPLPAKQVTSATFGGPNYDILFVTTSKYMNIEGGGDSQDGCTFMVTGLGVKGHPNTNFKLN